ncbi:MAG: iron-containing alcohol dehydrogenase [Anaerolineaceae bacterium]|nr:iron-containing alcohol dehydrogenase [Anaerolineaceae bacterium]
MIPSHYEFAFPVKIISGHDALNNLAAEMAQADALRPLVVTDNGVVKAGLLQVLLDALAETEVVIGAIFDQTPPDSSTQLVNELADLYRQKSCDSIIAIGGGSVIDTCKGVNILVSYAASEIREFRGAETLKGPFKPFYVVPTTAGTGSEATNAAVIHDPQRRVKMLFISDLLMPRAAFLDSRMTLTLPPKLSAATGVDALSHAMEAYISIQKNPMSDAFAWQAIALIGQYLRGVTSNPSDRNARLAMANASTMAGTAFSNAMVGCVHSMGHAAGAISRVPHGVCMNIFLPWGLRLNLSKRSIQIGELLLPLAGADLYAATPSEQRPSKTIEEVERLKEDLFILSGLPRTLKEAGVPSEKRDEICALAINDGSAVMNPVELDMDSARWLFDKAYG